MLIVWLETSSTLRTNHFPFPHLSSSNRDENDSNEEVPDEKVEREEELAGPVDLADGYIHIYQLAGVDVAFWAIKIVTDKSSRINPV